MGGLPHKIPVIKEKGSLVIMMIFLPLQIPVIKEKGSLVIMMFLSSFYQQSLVFADKRGRGK